MAATDDKTPLPLLSNAELAAAIAVADERCGMTTGTRQTRWETHLDALLVQQRRRAFSAEEPNAAGPDRRRIKLSGNDWLADKAGQDR